MSRTQILGGVLPIAETCQERRSSPVYLPRAGRTLAGMPTARNVSKEK